MFDLMPTVPTWWDIGLRLLLTVLAGGVIGMNRQVGGHAAGFRTTILVGLAACLAMIQANLLLATVGKSEQSFAVMDTLRFPLGILTGVGFIGGGAILKRGDLVTGVTTAATLWIVTAIGLCVGGGQIILGCVGAVVGFLVLSPFKWLDEKLPRRQKARMVISSKTGRVADLIAALQSIGCRARFMEKRRSSEKGVLLLTYELKWTGTAEDDPERIISVIEKSHQLDSFEVLNPTA
ncbi:MgtC/SapB family protein [Rhizobium sp. BK376]|uniref:MgtC/SapB family protein n=1 Tax=Rhizobium sp. BK376 TaxID=2512149 RepID=UPI0010E93E1D|nr:MgtC/SapB family protein [Rhizobium sp. BK376]TCR87664.1 putative Mg2+ transporter-C (MgtC) family protein [Rhizobium sp. BK376]